MGLAGWPARSAWAGNALTQKADPMFYRRVAIALLFALVSLPLAAQEGAEADPFAFTDEAALIFWQVRPEKVDDFTLVWRILGERAAAQGDERVRSILASVRLFRANAPSAPGTVTFVSRIEPVVAGASYRPTFLLFESGLFERPEADELFGLLSGALAEESPVSTIPLGPALPSATTLP